MKHPHPAHTKKAKTAKSGRADSEITFENPVLQRTYDAVLKNIRDAKNSTPKQARAWMERICAN